MACKNYWPNSRQRGREAERYAKKAMPGWMLLLLVVVDGDRFKVFRLKHVIA